MPQTDQTAGGRQLFNRLGDFYRRCRSACITLVLRTNARKWKKVAQAGPPPWDERNAIIARHIPAGSSVIDLGAGAQSLRSHLQPGCSYQPCDIIRSSPEVIFCDFNDGVYPEPGKTFDYVVCSGILEYIWKPRVFLARVPSLGSNLLLSYNPRMASESRFDRLAKNWVNHLKRPALEKLFDELGLTWKVVNVRQPNEYLYLINRKTSSAAA